MTVVDDLDLSADARAERTDLPIPLRLAGGIWGHLVGDAVGVPYEFRSPEAIGEVEFGAQGAHGQPPGTWSDDGALMLALLDSLLVAGFDPEDQGRRALAWRRKGAYAPGGTVFDIGGTTSEALRRLEQGTPAEEAGPTGEHSQSNGSLMRIVPLALWATPRPRLGLEELADRAARASKVTHGHPTCQVTCAAYVLTAALLLHGDSPRIALETALEALRDQYRSSGPDELAEALNRFEAWPIANQPAGRGGALNAFWSAWTAFAGAIDYRDTIERAIRYGNDTDTTAAIAGGLAGIYWGLDGIPAEWLAGLRGREIAEPLIDSLIQGHGWKTSVSNPIRIDWVDLAQVRGLAGAPGRLGMTFLPGKKGIGYSGDWWRDLDADVAALRELHGCDTLLLLVEDNELVSTKTTQLSSAFERHGIELRRHPVIDMNVPADAASYRSTLEGMTGAIRAGQTVVIACRGGLGRTGTAVACLLVDAGMEPDAAIALTRAARPKAIERGIQVAWVRAWRLAI